MIMLVLAIAVGLVVYACIGAVMVRIAQRRLGFCTDAEDAIPAAIFWPLVCAAGIVFCLGWVITWPARYIWFYQPKPTPPPAPEYPVAGTPPLMDFED